MLALSSCFSFLFMSLAWTLRTGSIHLQPGAMEFMDHCLLVSAAGTLRDGKEVAVIADAVSLS